MQATTTQSTTIPATSIFESIAHQMLIGTIGGFITGAVVGGIGGRIAMRIVGIMTKEPPPTFFTDNGNRLGEITLGGTLELVIFSGLLGIFVGLLFMATRHWLPGPRWWYHGLGFGALTLAVFGSFIIDADNRDFRLFGEKPVNVLLFAALFLLFGLMVAWLTTYLERLSFLRRGGLAMRLGIITVVGLLYLMLVGIEIETLISPDFDDPPRYQQVLSLMLLLFMPAGLVIAAAQETDRRWNQQIVRLLYLPLGLAVLVGIYFDVDTLSKIF